MNGVEILASSEVVIESAFNWHTFGCVFGGVFAFCFVLGILISIVESYWHNLAVGSVIGLIFGIGLGIGGGFVGGIPLAYDTQHKVIISDEVQMNCFLEKYEILDQEGKIYTVREKQ